MSAPSAATPTRVARERSTLAALLGIFPRLLSWWPVGVSGLAVAVIVGWQWSDLTQPTVRLSVVRVSVLFFVLGSVFLLDDASRVTTDSSAVTRRRRIGLRLVVMLATVAVGTGIVFGVVLARGPMSGLAPGFALEVVGFTCLAAGIALVLQQRFGVDEPASFAGLGIVGLVLAVPMLAMRWPMIVGPGPLWHDAHVRWAGVLLVALAVVAYLTRDPAAGSLLRARTRPNRA